VARAAGQSFDAFLHERIFEPLGMTDTGFFVPAASRDRFGPVYIKDPESGARVVYDPADGQWAALPAFPSGAAGLVSTVRDYLAFGRMLLGGGVLDGQRILSRSWVEAMTTDQLTTAQREASGPEPDGSAGWGLGVGVRVRRTGPATVGTYGWTGGLGSVWSNDPTERLVGVLLTNQAWESPTLPPVCEDFWSLTYAALDD
jgi:CubicO group peptidase (beta-lactamase class C family)